MIADKNIRAVVTGASSGLGRAIALRVADGGGRVLVSDIDEAGGAETVAMVQRRGGSATFRRCDVRDAAEVQALVEAADVALGGCDLVVNNAGVAVAGPIGKVPLEDWKWQIDINLWGVIHGCHSFVPYFRERGRGHVLNVASVAGLVSVPGMAPYNVTKFAVVALSEALQGELAGTDIGVTVLCPSFFETDILKNARNSGMETSMASKAMHRSRVQADDVARIALEAAHRGDLYAMPHLEGRAMWGLKRLAPRLTQGLLARLAARQRR